MGSKLFIGNLPPGSSDIALSDFVTQSGFRLISAAVARDELTGEPRRYGLVELAEGEDFQRAIGDLNGQPFVGRGLITSNAHPPRRGFSRPATSGFDRHLFRRWAC